MNNNENCGEHKQVVEQAQVYREMWRKFEYGESLTTGELRLMKRQAEQGLEYLRARGEKLAMSKTSMDIATINSMLMARKEPKFNSFLKKVNVKNVKNLLKS